MILSSGDAAEQLGEMVEAEKAKGLRREARRIAEGRPSIVTWDTDDERWPLWNF